MSDLRIFDPSKVRAIVEGLEGEISSLKSELSKRTVGAVLAENMIEAERQKGEALSRVAKLEAEREESLNWVAHYNQLEEIAALKAKLEALAAPCDIEGVKFCDICRPVGEAYQELRSKLISSQAAFKMADEHRIECYRGRYEQRVRADGLEARVNELTSLLAETQAGRTAYNAAEIYKINQRLLEQIETMNARAQTDAQSYHRDQILISLLRGQLSRLRSLLEGLLEIAQDRRWVYYENSFDKFECDGCHASVPDKSPSQTIVHYSTCPVVGAKRAVQGLP